MNKRAIIILLFVIAAILIILAVGLKMYAGSQVSTSGGTPVQGGQVNLAVLPQENSNTPSISEGGAG